MTELVWHKGPPPSIGWWPASRAREASILRWWDGVMWSAPANKGMSPESAAEQARFRDEWNTPLIEWTDRPDDWPERSRT